MKFFLVVIALAVTNAIPQNHREINRESPQKDRQIYIIDPQIPQHQINPISARYPGFVAERPLLPRYVQVFYNYSLYIRGNSDSDNFKPCYFLHLD